MLTNDQQYIVQLLRKSLITDYCEDVFPEDIQTIANIIIRNSILPTVYHKLPIDLKKQLNNQYFTAIRQSIVQEHEGEQVLNSLSNAGLDCIALKGWELRKLYPATTMRQMADLDILVRPYNYHVVKAVMDNLGFTTESESSWKHDNFSKNDINVEMHKRLTDDSDKIQAWERGMWDRATVVNDRIYRMSPEDYYIFHFVHLHKDFINGSLGLRRIVDTWLLQKQAVDMKTVKSHLESFGIWNFHNHIVHLSKVTMGEGIIDEDTELLLNHAFTKGIYGSGKSYKAGRIVAMGENLESGKLKSKLAAVFLPYKRMKAQFPVLEKYPVLLPWYWMKRIVRFLKGDKKKYSHMLNYSEISKEDFEEMKRFFKAGGIE